MSQLRKQGPGIPGHPASRRSGRAWARAAGLGACLATLAALSAAAAQPPPVPPPVPSPPAKASAARITRNIPSGKQLSDMILEVDLGPYVLSQGMLGYLDREGVLYLPLGAYARMLDFPIRVDPDAERASGWFLNENRLFSLDVRGDQVIIDGRSSRFDPAAVRVIDHDIYVDVRLLARWFPVDIAFDLANLVVRLTSREPLPLEQRMARERREKRVLANRRAPEQYPVVKAPYDWVSWPTIDTSLDFSMKRGGTGAVPALTHSTLAAADIGKVHGNFFVSGDSGNSLSYARMTFSRRDFDGGLLGPLGATEFSFGDVTTPEVPLISNTNLGRGVTVSTFPLDRISQFDRTTVEGNLNSGWEVELYRNETLLDFQKVGSDGRYKFQNVPLLFGVNDLRLVFYGPQGQVREETRQIRVGAGQAPPAAHEFRMTVSQDSRTVIDLASSSSTAGNKDFGKDRWTAEYLGGVTRNLSVAGYAAGLTLDGVRHNYVGAGARASLGNVYGRLDVVEDVSRGTAVKAAAQTSVFGTSISAEHDTFLSGYESERTGGTDDPLTQSTSLRWDGVINLGSGLNVHMPFDFTNTHEIRQSGATQTFVENRMSTSFGRLNFTHRTSWRYQEDGGQPDTAEGTGSLLAGGRIGELRLRSVLGYDWRPRARLTSASLYGDWRIDETYDAQGSVSSDLVGSSGTDYSVGLNGHYPAADVGFKVDYNTNSEIVGRLTVSFSLAKDPRSDSVHMRSTRMASSGLVSVRAYRDVDANGTFDAKTDKPLAGVTFTSDGMRSQTKTDKDGVALIDGLDTDHRIHFALDDASLADPYAVPEKKGVAVALQPGVPAKLDFPVVTTGEIDGTVYRQRGTWSDPVSDAEIQLVDHAGKVAMQTKSAYDGYYLFSYVRPGDYEIRANPQQAKRLGLTPPPPQFVRVGPDGDIIDGQDLVYFLQSADATTIPPGERDFRVLLSIFENADHAQAAWKKLQREMPAATRGLADAVEKKQIPGRDSMVRVLYATGLKTRQAAETLCTEVRQKKGAAWCNPLVVEMRSRKTDIRSKAIKE